MSQTHVSPEQQDKTTKEIRVELIIAMKNCIENPILQNIWKVQVLSAELIKWIML